MNKLYTFLILLSFGFANSQIVSDQFPVFPGCESTAPAEMETCFNNKIQEFVYAGFKMPSNVPSDFSGSLVVLFEVDAEGKFKVQYVDSPIPELADEIKRVFATLPKISPPAHNGNPTYAKYTFRMAFPMQSATAVAVKSSDADQKSIGTKKGKPDEPELNEYAAVKSEPYDNPEFKSTMNIPFSHSYYAQFDMAINQVGSNNHTGSKPQTYAEVSKYYDLQGEFAKLRINTSTRIANKLWNANTVEFRGADYWFTLNPIIDFEVGKSSDLDHSTFINTRGLQFRGGLGEQVTFTTSIYESQGRFADYFNDYAESIAPSGGGPAIIPGVGIAKRFKTDAYDFPLAEANLSYTPSKFFNLQLGYGRNFIGDGYRSLLESDGASPYPYFKLNTTFWKIKYTNTYMWLKDVRPEVTEDRTYETKYMANHYLSWNVSKRINMGFFESVVWANTNGRGFDANFINPIIFYRTVEFSSSARSGNALLGATMKYKVNNHINLYGQYLLDEFSLEDMKAGNKSWKNKFGYQIGGKYYNAFKIDNLLLQVEYNHVRPYVYAHSDPLTNYAHNNQSMGHQWGGNFSEVIAIARYHQGRYFGDVKVTYGVRGLDFNNGTDNFNYGSNIFRNYDEDRPYDVGVKIGQGNKTTVFIADLQAGYLVNPALNLKLFGSYIYRNFDPTQETAETFKRNTSWFTIGLRCDLFNWYFDY